MTQEDNVAKPELTTAGEAIQDNGEAIRVSERAFQRTFGSAPYGMAVISLAEDRPNAYIAVNDAFCRLTGYSRAELTGAAFLSEVHPEEQSVLEALTGQVVSGAIQQIRADTRLVRKDGEIVPVRLTGSAMQPTAVERYLVTYLEDRTAHTQAQAEVGRLECELQRLRRLDSLGQLADGIAHDFNNMLTVITNFASLVRDEVTGAEATEGAARWGPVRWDIEQIEEAADRARRLIRHLMAFARREQARPAPVELGRLTDDATGLLREVLGEHIDIVTRHGDGLWPVEADPGLLEQAIINVALNARDAMPEGGQVIIETANVDTADPGAAVSGAFAGETAHLAEMLPGHYVVVRVTDNGAGMNAMTAERAFEPFFTTKPGDQAAGLGLPAVRRIAVQAGGRAWLASEPGEGTTVTVALPAAPGSAVTSAAGQQASGRAGRAAAILVVDHEAAIRDVAYRVLTSAGYQVMTASNGQAAIALLAEPDKRADLLLTDVVMPGICGETFVTRARAICPGIRVLFMSGYERLAAPARSWPHPPSQVIAKPFSRAALLARVSQALAAETAAGDAAAVARRARAERPGDRF